MILHLTTQECYREACLLSLSPILLTNTWNSSIEHYEWITSPIITVQTVHGIERVRCMVERSTLYFSHSSHRLNLPTHINKIKLHMYSVWHKYTLHYTKTEIPNTSPASTFTTVKLRIKYEIKLLFNKTKRRTNFQIYSGTKLYMFRVVPLPIIRSWLLYIRHWHMLYRSDDS